MAKNQTRRDFFLTAPLAAAATLSLSEQSLFASTGAPQATDAPAPGQFQLFTADTLQGYIKTLQTTLGNHQLSGSKTTPFTSVLTVETNKSAKEFEYHEHRDHIFQIIDGTTQYELGGTPQNPRNTAPGEWLAPGSESAKSVVLNKGDLLVIPRGMAHKRSTTGSVTLLLISIQDVP